MINFKFTVLPLVSSPSSSLVYTLHYYAPGELATLVEHLVAHRLQPFVGTFHGFLAELSLTKIPKNRPDSIETARSRYGFDLYYSANMCEEEWAQYDKYQLTYRVMEHHPTTQLATAFDVKCRENFNVRFGHVQAYVRAILSNASLSDCSSSPRAINDNFLNFTDRTELDVESSYRRLMKLSEVDQKCRDLVALVRQQLEQHAANLRTVCVSFNGGKDCTVLLHVLSTLFYHHNHHHQNGRLQLMMIKTMGGEQFQELDLYVARVSAFYRGELKTFHGVDLKSTLHDVKRLAPFKTVFMGVRRSDLPRAVGEKLRSVQRTDTERGWADFMRVHPLLDWTYTDVWRFLMDQAVPYCPLYDYGYTSLDSPHNTTPNQTLMVDVQNCEGEKHTAFLPAYLLEQDSLERSNRV